MILRSAVAIFAASCGARLVYLLTSGRWPVRLDGEMVRAAVSLAETGTLGNPYAVPTGTTAHVAPAYPALLAVLHWLTGGGDLFHWMAYALSAVAYAALAAAMPWVAERVGLDRRAGVLAGFGLACWFPRFEADEMGAFEISFSAWALAGLFVAAVALLRKGDASGRGVVWLSVAGGVSLWLQPALLPVICCLLALVIWRGGVRKRLRAAALAAGMVAVISLPWMVRNQVELGYPFFFRSNFGLELKVSNTDEASALLAENQEGLLDRVHPYSNQREALEVRREGEAAYQRRQQREAFEWIAAHPSAFARLTTQRVVAFWIPRPRRSYGSFYHSALSALDRRGVLVALEAGLVLLAVAGLLLLFRRDAGVAMLAVWLSFPPIYYLVQATPRYRIPMEWSVFLAAAVAVLWISRAVARRAGGSSSAGESRATGPGIRE